MTQHRFCDGARRNYDIRLLSIYSRRSIGKSGRNALFLYSERESHSVLLLQCIKSQHGISNIKHLSGVPLRKSAVPRCPSFHVMRGGMGSRARTRLVAWGWRADASWRVGGERRMVGEYDLKLRRRCVARCQKLLLRGAAVMLP